MARSTRKSLATTAASAARKVITRRPSGKKAAPDKKAAPNKKAAPDKKAAPKKVAAKKSAPATKTVARKTVAKKTAAKKAPAKKAAPKKTAPAKKAAAKKAPAKKAAAKKTAPAKKAAAKRAPAKKAAVKKAATKRAPATKAPAKKVTKKQPAKSPNRKATTAKKAAKAAPLKKAAPAKKAAAAKRPATRKSAPSKASALRVREGEGAWTKADLKEVLDELHSERERVSAALHAQEEELALLMRDAGDGAGHDQADMGATSFERDHELNVLNNEREKLAQIDRALARIDDGSYGICESCGNPIGKMRTMAFPRATLCLTCKQREERR